MEAPREKYINGPATRPFTDYGFKQLFGEEPNKDLLLDFLLDRVPAVEALKRSER